MSDRVRPRFLAAHVGLLLAAWRLCGAAYAGEWRLTGSETLPAFGVTHFRQSVASDNEDATLDFVSFDSRGFIFRVIDQGPAGGLSLEKAMVANGFAAGVNGGYFHADFSPVGLLVADGKIIHPAQRAALLSGILQVDTAGRARLLRQEEYHGSPAIMEAIQCGPFLVDAGAPVPGLNALRSARRTVVLTDGAGRWALASTSPLTLAETGQLLAMPGVVPGGLRVSRALNLDGGPSTGLWVRGSGGEPYYIPEISTVRDFLGVAPR